MLVLSRRETETIRFPDLGITIEVLRVKGNSVRLGVDAPIEIKVLRGELESPSSLPERTIQVTGESEHKVRNRLNALTIATSIADRHLQANRPELAANILDRALRKLEGKVNPSLSVQESTDEIVESPLGLLVEDSENERTMLAGLLRLHGYRIATVGDGAEALNYLDNSDQPDFILMDMCMPNLDGPSAIRMIRECPAFDSIEIYAVSGETAQSVGLDLGRNRIADWFQKPLDPKRLLNTINRRVGQNAN